MKSEFKAALVTEKEYKTIISSMPLNEKDKHVLAAAVASNSQIIVTQNLKDFPRHLLAPFSIEALSADDFLIRQFDQNADMMVRIIIEQARILRKPPQTPLEILNRLNLFAPTFAERIRRRLETNLLR